MRISLKENGNGYFFLHGRTMKGKFPKFTWRAGGCTSKKHSERYLPGDTDIFQTCLQGCTNLKPHKIRKSQQNQREFPKRGQWGATRCRGWDKREGGCLYNRQESVTPWNLKVSSPTQWPRHEDKGPAAHLWTQVMSPGYRSPLNLSLSKTSKGELRSELKPAGGERHPTFHCDHRTTCPHQTFRPPRKVAAAPRAGRHGLVPF